MSPGARRALRALLPSLASVGYVLAVGVRAGARGTGALIIGIAAVALAVRAARAAERVDAWASWGAGIALAASLAAGRPLALGVGWLGVAVASVAAGQAIVGAASLGGLGAEHVRLYHRAPKRALVAAWALVPALGALAAVTRAPLLTQASFAAGQVIVVGLLLAHELFARRFDLGLPERLRALLLVAAVVVVTGATLPWSGASAVLASAVGTLGLLGPILVLVARRGDAARIAAIARVALVGGAAGGGLLLFMELVLLDRPHDAGAILFAVGVGSVAIGALAAEIARPLRPAQGALLDAIDAARLASTRAEPDEALREVLAALRVPSGPTAPSPVLYTLTPPRALVVDAAGYAREREAEPHPLALATAAREPCGVLRVSVLEALEVRRPDLRPLLAHLEGEGALACVVVEHAGDPEGLLVIPEGQRTAPLSLEEVRALGALADRLAGLCASRAALARSLERERLARAHAEQLEGALGRREHESGLDAARERLAAGRLARPATVATYSAASRMAYDALERRARAGAPFVVFAPAGVDPVPYVARAHLAGVRADAPLVIVDATLAREHELARWKDPLASPLALAHRGVLLLLDGAVLPAEVQALVGQALAEKRAPWERPEPLDVLVGVTSAWPRDRLEAGLEPTLAARLGDALDAAIALPAVHDRPEDLRSLVTDRLAREGLRLRGRPIGIEDAAFARLVEHSFEGGDAELAAIVLQLAVRCEGDVVRAADVDRLGLQNSADTPDEAPAPPPNVRPIRR